MSKREYISRYLTIYNKLRSSREATFEEINDFLKRESEFSGYKLSISQRTFQRNLNEMRSLFNIDIKCNALNKYFISDEGQADINNRMLEAFDVFNFLNMARDLSEHIYFENHKLTGTENIHGFLHAIKKRLVIRFNHNKF